jgi:hypothetical protein
MIRAGLWYFPHSDLDSSPSVYQILRVMNDLERGFQQHIAVYSSEGIPFLYWNKWLYNWIVGGKGLRTHALLSAILD